MANMRQDRQTAGSVYAWRWLGWKKKRWAGSPGWPSGWCGRYRFSGSGRQDAGLSPPNYPLGLGAARRRIAVRRGISAIFGGTRDDAADFRLSPWLLGRRSGLTVLRIHNRAPLYWSTIGNRRFRLGNFAFTASELTDRRGDCLRAAKDLPKRRPHGIGPPPQSAGA